MARGLRRQPGEFRAGLSGSQPSARRPIRQVPQFLLQPLVHPQIPHLAHPRNAVWSDANGHGQ